MLSKPFLVSNINVWGCVIFFTAPTPDGKYRLFQSGVQRFNTILTVSPKISIQSHKLKAETYKDAAYQTPVTSRVQAIHTAAQLQIKKNKN